MAISSSGNLALDAPHKSAGHNSVPSSGRLMRTTSWPSNFTMPLVGFGTCGKCNGPGLEKAFAAFLDEGGRMFDTGAMYGNHALLGNLVESSGVPREEFFMIDKINPHSISEPKHVMQQIDKTLRDLHHCEHCPRYVDLMLIHGPWGPLGSTPKGRELLWQELIRAKKLGKVKHIGVSNFDRTMIEALSHATGEWPVANEFEYHPWVRPHVKDLARWCQRSGIHVIAYGSLGTGGFSRTYPAAVQLAADSHETSPSNVLLRWALDQDVAVIPSSGSPEHIRSNLLLGLPSGKFKLLAQEKAAIEAEPRPKGWRHCTLLAGCFQFDADDHDVQDSRARSSGSLKSTLVNLVSNSWQSLKAAVSAVKPKFVMRMEPKKSCIPRISDFTPDSMDRIRQRVADRPELQPHIARNRSRGLGVIVLDTFLSPAETEATVKEVKKAKFENFSAVEEYGHANVAKMNLSSTNVAKQTKFNCFRDSTPAAIRSVCNKVINTIGTHSQYLEPTVGIRVYSDDAAVHHHVDQAPAHEYKYCGRRTLTFLVHLGHAEGGATRFDSLNGSDYRVGVKPGRGVIFPVVDATVPEEMDPNTDLRWTSIGHEGEVVTSGEKILMTFWFRQFPYAERKALEES